jgi:hypothetical protein
MPQPYSITSPHEPRIISNGTDLIIRDIGSCSKHYKEGSLYHCYKDLHITDIKTKSAVDCFTNIIINGNSLDGVISKRIKIPEHIPTDQHVRYIQGIFDSIK